MVDVSGPGLSPGSGSVLCSRLLPCQSRRERQASRAGGAGRGRAACCAGFEAQLLYGDVGRTGEERNLTFSLHLKREPRLLNKQRVRCWRLW